MARRTGGAFGAGIRGRMRAGVAALAAGTGAALWPLVALAEDAPHAEAASRALSAPNDVGSVALIAIGALLAVFAIAGLGYLYRRERRLDWSFQRPDAPHEEHH